MGRGEPAEQNAERGDRKAVHRANPQLGAQRRPEKEAHHWRADEHEAAKYQTEREPLLDPRPREAGLDMREDRCQGNEAAC